MRVDVLKTVKMNGTETCRERWYGEPVSNVEDSERARKRVRRASQRCRQEINTTGEEEGV